MGWSMDRVHGPGPRTGSTDRVHGVVHGGPWTGSMGWSMDPGPCFVYVPKRRNWNSFVKLTVNSSAATIHRIHDGHVKILLEEVASERRAEVMSVIGSQKEMAQQMRLK